MANYLTIPINENGVIVDNYIDTLIASAMSASFAFSDVYLYSHGWALDSTKMMDWYNRFSIEYNKSNIDLIAAHGNIFTQMPTANSLGVGIHWPSMITENENDPLTYLQQLTFYTMDKRAGTVGEHGLYAVLRLILSNPQLQRYPQVRLNLLGHSFGCKVVASALEQIYQDLKYGKIPAAPNVSFNAVLLQGAFERNELDDAECYGDVKLLNIRLLVTRSDADEALQTWFDDAHFNVDFFQLKHKDPDKRALGALGPTDKTKADMGGAGAEISVGPGFDCTGMAARRERILVADLTPIHNSRGQQQGYARFSGHHSDIFLPEIYSLIAGFLYNNNAQPKPQP
jgi:ABC-type amino acid transport substrate-binding protein